MGNYIKFHSGLIEERPERYTHREREKLYIPLLIGV